MHGIQKHFVVLPCYGSSLATFKIPGFGYDVHYPPIPIHVALGLTAIHCVQPMTLCRVCGHFVVV